MTQKIIESNGSSWLIIRIPEHTKSYTFRASAHCDYDSISFYDTFTDEETVELIAPGHYTLYGRGSDLTEDQWREIVEWYKDSFTWYKNYGESNIWFKHPIASGLSWLSHHGFKPESAVILKLEK